MLPSRLVHLHVHIRCRVVLAFALCQNFSPQVVHVARHYVHLTFLFLETLNDLVSCLLEEFDFFQADAGAICLRLPLLQLFFDELKPFHVEGNHTKGDAGLVVLELFFEFDG